MKDYVKNTAIVLAGGSGSRMNSDIPKQYIEILDNAQAINLIVFIPFI